jgi:hypothetical protein
MPAVKDTAALYYEQYSVTLPQNTPGVPVTIFHVSSGGELVDVVARFPNGHFPNGPLLGTVKNIPWVETGVAVPTSGPYVTAPDYAPPAPPAPPAP